jgi:hypothetical protein
MKITDRLRHTGVGGKIIVTVTIWSCACHERRRVSTAADHLLLVTAIDARQLGSPPGRFALQKILRLPTNWRLVGSQRPLWRLWGKDKTLTFAGNPTTLPRLSGPHYLVATSTKLSRLTKKSWETGLNSVGRIRLPLVDPGEHGNDSLGSIQNREFNHLETKRRLLYLKTQSVTRSKHFFISVIKTNQLCWVGHKSLSVLR